MLFTAAATFTLTNCSRTGRFRSRRAFQTKTRCATQTEDLGQLVASASAAARAPARETSPASGTIAIATRFLWTRFISHERTTFDAQAVEFPNGPCRIIFRPEFNKSETLRSTRVPIHDDAGRDRLVALRSKQLQQAFIGDTVRQTSYVKLGHMLSSVLIGSAACRVQQPTRLA